MITQALGPSAPGRDARIAFESIDGAPPEILHRLTDDIKAEAAARQIAVVPANGDAAYRIRGYLAAQAERGSTSIAWTWDVYDAGQHRAFRLGGQEVGTGPAGASDRKGTSGQPPDNRWAAADETLLRRIARAGMDQLTGFITAGPAPAAPDVTPSGPPRGGSVVASLGAPGR